MNREPDFYLNLQLPVHIPNEEEIDFISEHLDGFLTKLVSQEYITEQEAVAYTKFASMVGGMLPFLLDEFVERYRKGKWKKEVQDEARKKASVVKPTDEDIQSLT